jgi:hypothetical protein
MRLTHLCQIGLILCAGCSSVTSTAQLGSPVSADVAKEFEGVWLTSDNEPFWVKHVKDNELRVASLEWKKSDYQLVQLSAFVTEDENQRYVNFTKPGQGEKHPEFEFLRAKGPESDLLVLTLPRADTFAHAVESGKLSGKVNKKEDHVEVVLDSPTKQLDEFVTPSKANEQFDLDGVEVFRRVKHIDEKQ